MPTYAYSCQNCKVNLEFSHKISDEPLKNCPSCLQPTLKRGPGGGIGLSFKGSGFYINDYAKEKTPAAEKTAECCPCGKNQCE